MATKQQLDTRLGVNEVVQSIRHIYLRVGKREPGARVGSSKYRSNFTLALHVYQKIKIFDRSGKSKMTVKNSGAKIVPIRKECFQGWFFTSSARVGKTPGASVNFREETYNNGYSS